MSELDDLKRRIEALEVAEKGMSADEIGAIPHALDEIFSTYGDTVSVTNKKKSLLKFGDRVTTGTGWETLMTLQGTEVEETLLSTNGITTIVSSSGSDTHPIKIEYHTIAAGLLTFGVQTATLTGTTPATIPTACARSSRMQNADGSPLVGTIYLYEGGVRTDINTHITIPAGEQQTQKCATSIADGDYWILTGATINVLEKVTKYAEARIEVRAVGKTYWLPITQTFTTTDSTGTIALSLDPYRIIPPNSDVRLAVRTNTSGVEVTGAISGYLAN